MKRNSVSYKVSLFSDFYLLESFPPVFDNSLELFHLVRQMFPHRLFSFDLQHQKIARLEFWPLFLSRTDLITHPWIDSLVVTWNHHFFLLLGCQQSGLFSPLLLCLLLVRIRTKVKGERDKESERGNIGITAQAQAQRSKGR